MKYSLSAIIVGACFFAFLSPVTVANGASTGLSCARGQSQLPVLKIESATFPINVGDEINITCTVCGKKYTFWFKDGKRFGETHRIHWISAKIFKTRPRISQGKLNILKLKKKDSGTYTCYALNFFTNLLQKGDIKLVANPHHKIIHSI